MHNPRFRSPCGLILAVMLLLFALPPSVSADPQAPIAPEVLATIKDAGKATYWVVLRDRADLAQASRMSHEARGRFVVDQLRLVADRSQAGLRALLNARGSDVTPFWAANVLKVSSDQATLEAIAARPEVEKIEPDRTYRIPDPVPVRLEPDEV